MSSRYRPSRSPRDGIEIRRSWSFYSSPVRYKCSFSCVLSVPSVWPGDVGGVVWDSVTETTATPVSGLDRAPGCAVLPGSSALPACVLLAVCVLLSASVAASFLDSMGALIDNMVEADRVIARVIARAAAQRAALIDQARSWSEATASHCLPDADRRLPGSPVVCRPCGPAFCGE